MDPLFVAIAYYRRKKFEQCIKKCEEILEKAPYNQTSWSLKMRAMVESVYVDDIEADEEGITELLLDDNAIAQVARPGTSLKTPISSGASSQSFRPTTMSGRPLSGIIRPSTKGGRPRTIDQALRTSRSSASARPVSTSSGRLARLGTASMLSQPDGPFVNLARLNLSKYSMEKNLNRSLFEYMFYHENDIRRALDLAAQATVHYKFKDGWWKIQLGKCYHRMGLYRDAEKQFKSSLKDNPCIEAYLQIGRIYLKLDQPMAALEYYNNGLEIFPDEVSLLVAAARVQESLNDQMKALSMYKEVLQQDAINVEAIACLGAHHFYSDQPELALRFYRRLLQMGINNSEIYTNVGLCCFYAQQYDMTLRCFERALSLASDTTAADVWYNIGHVALGVGDLGLAYQCFHLAISYSNEYGEAYNNLGVLEMKKGHIEQARAFFQIAGNINQFLFEPLYNYALLSEKIGDLQSSYIIVQKALKVFPQHRGSHELLNQLQKHFTSM